jgi:hypothetical protein
MASSIDLLSFLHAIHRFPNRDKIWINLKFDSCLAAIQRLLIPVMLIPVMEERAAQELGT